MWKANTIDSLALHLIIIVANFNPVHIASYHPVFFFLAKGDWKLLREESNGIVL